MYTGRIKKNMLYHHLPTPPPPKDDNNSPLDWIEHEPGEKKED